MNRVPCTIILAAGKGTRMGSSDTPKVCFPLNGTPAIVRAMRVYRNAGVKQFLVVVGNLAEKVMATVTPEFPETNYAFQPEQNGTADAVACALAGARFLQDDDDVLVVAGDRFLHEDVLAQFFEKHQTSNADLTLLGLHLTASNSQGRILMDSSRHPFAVVEMAEVRQHRAFAALREAVASGATRETMLETLCNAFFPGKRDPAKAAKAFGKVWELLTSQAPLDELPALLEHAPGNFVFQTANGSVELTLDEVDASPFRNTSVYLVKAGLLRRALPTFTRENAQQEIYLTDLVNFVYQQNLATGTPRTELLAVDNPDKILGFNNPSELLQAEKALAGQNRQRAPRPAHLFRTLQQWRTLFAEGHSQGTPFHKLLVGIYGDDDTIIERQLLEMERLAESATKRFSDNTPLMFVRAPGRLNTMGRHIDHQGGNCNLMTISFETMIFVAERNDDTVTLDHCQPELFPSTTFRIRDLLQDLPWEDWNTLVDSETLSRRHREAGITWSDYIQAAVLRVQKKYRDIPLAGMEMLVNGNIPMAAGLSSSSSLIVCTSEALVRLNGLETYANQFVTLCGESEWFVGTHGGSADHAAVKLGSRDAVTRVRFFPFAVERTVLFPAGYQMVVCDSGLKARKSSNAKDQFNHRVACYRIGFALIRQFCPQYAAVLHYLRDVNTETLHVPLREIYKILLMLPENPTRAELEQILPSHILEPLFAGHASTPERHYPVRGVVLFGLAEMQRAAKYADALQRADIPAIGKMMAISHDGDRVVSHDENLRELPYAPHISNSDLLALLDDLDSGDVARVTRAQLECQPGAYGCSLPDIDLMVDIASRVPGVAGAQLAGAGLGGCMMILTKHDAIPPLRQALRDGYYAPRGLEERILSCRPVAGASPLFGTGN
ncbi:MAG: NTP transferase domain-containing protein [Victivallales bacterium]|nr:NTP transferase domain-containing protein [Victivallales bacterium]